MFHRNGRNGACFLFAGMYNIPEDGKTADSDHLSGGEFDKIYDQRGRRVSCAGAVLHGQEVFTGFMEFL